MLAARRALAASGPAAPPVLNLVAHYDASQIAGVADGATLGQGGVTWPNLVDPPFGNLTGGNTGKTGPTFYKTTAGKLIKGLPAVWFSTTGGCGIWTGTFQWVAPTDGSYSVYVVAHGDGSAAAQQGVASSDDVASERFFRIQLSSTQSRFLVLNNAASVFEVDGPAASTSQVTVFALTVDGTGLSMQGWMNNVSMGTAALTGPLNKTASAFALGDVGPVGGNPLNGPVPEAYVYQGAHAPATASQINKYLMAKWQ